MVSKENFKRIELEDKLNPNLKDKDNLLAKIRIELYKHSDSPRIILTYNSKVEDLTSLIKEEVKNDDLIISDSILDQFLLNFFSSKDKNLENIEIWEKLVNELSNSIK